MGLLAAGAVAVGCSTDKPSASQVSSGSNAEVKVDGKDLAGLDLKSVTCVKQGGKINVASAGINGQQGLGVVMTDATPPKVESLGLVYDGAALAVSSGMGASVGSADVKVDGKTYTISGEAAGADVKNPMAGMITKSFTIKVSCG
ncbi:hypothetical protein FZI91_05330 [Mycobacterium sp. CBMA271]|nr:hypothetical protein [Mycobacteroides sp. CBMA 271]